MALPYPNIDPVAISIGPLPIRWYSLGYIGGLALGWWYLSRILSNAKLWNEKTRAPISREQLDDVVFWVAIGVMAGGRIGYVLFYKAGMLLQPWRPLREWMPSGFLETLIGWLPIPPALALWDGGMSFHGGLIGVTLAGLWYARKYKVPPLQLGDLFACAAPIGIALVRIANFINGELYGRPTSAAVGMVFPADPLQTPRHPSQLYEAALEGFVLFFVVRLASHHFKLLQRPGATMGVFLAGYGLARIFVENFREPDAHLPNFPLGLTMGMFLSLPMLAIGGWLLRRALNRGAAADAPAAGA